MQNRKTIHSFFFATAFCISSSCYSDVEIATSPLITDASVPPNVMYLYDDSGSMQWEVLPDALRFGDYYLFPPPSLTTSPYGGSEYSGPIAEFKDDSYLSFGRRSSHNNTLFYNPAVTYEPWRKADGSAFPQSDPARAKYSPADPTSQTLDLTGPVSSTQNWIYAPDPVLPAATSLLFYAYNVKWTCGSKTIPCAKSYYPATFYVYKGAGDVKSKSNYTKYVIKGHDAYKRDLATDASDVPIGSFSWPGDITRSPAQELQNFANWFTYYRSTRLATIGATSIAFSELGTNYRVGYASINTYSMSTWTAPYTPAHKTMLIPLDGTFTGSNRSNWYQRLFLGHLGQGGTPLRGALQFIGDYYSGLNGESNPWGPAPELSCRKSFVIIASDGAWNDRGSFGADNADGSPGGTILGTKGESYTYDPEPPYSDTWTDTLADIAAKYWKTDLNTALPNNVAPSTTDPAFWQHMTTFGIGIGLAGNYDPETDLPALTSGAKIWQNPTNDARKIDDFWHATINGKGRYFTSNTPEEILDSLRKTLSSISREGAAISGVAGNSQRITAGSYFYQATFESGSWSGELRSWKSIDVAAGTATEKWKASEKLPPADARNIKTWIDGAAVAFLGASVTARLGAGDSAANLLAYLRGDRSYEQSEGGPYRTRASLLGDFVNSSPVYVGSPASRSYSRYPWAGSGTYNAFVAAKKSRQPVVYIGGNDGMLHAFDANTGVEIFAYVPSEVLPRLKSLADVEYPHYFFVDGEIAVDDIYTSSGWRSILVSSLGRGGKSVFALDVTNPSDIKPIWEFQNEDLGYTLSQPQILRLNNGQWAVALGNGYNSSSGQSALILINAEDGSLIKTIRTGVGGSNGMGQLAAWDEPQDGVFDYIYAGDLRGNLWKFDLTSNSPASWKIASGKNLFAAKDASGIEQPITSAPTLGIHPGTGERWIFFGTGRFISPGDQSDHRIQTWYGVRDKVITSIDRTTLVERIIAKEGTSAAGDYRVFSAEGDAKGGESLTPAKDGWYIDLARNAETALGERMLSRNILVGDLLIGSSIVPTVDACDTGGNGWLMAVNPWLGGRTAAPVLDINGDKTIDDKDAISLAAGDGEAKVAAGGMKVGNGSVPNIQILDAGTISITSSPADGSKPTGLVAKNSAVTGRLSWKEIVRQ